MHECHTGILSCLFRTLFIASILFEIDSVVMAILAQSESLGLTRMEITWYRRVHSHLLIEIS